MEGKMENIDNDAMLDPRAVEATFNVAVATQAKQRCLGGGPPFIKAGRKILYRRGDWIEYLNARKVRNTTEAATLPRRLTDAIKTA
jgi:hypothetical protein